MVPLQGGVPYEGDGRQETLPFRRLFLVVLRSRRSRAQRAVCRPASEAMVGKRGHIELLLLALLHAVTGWQSRAVQSGLSSTHKSAWMPQMLSKRKGSSIPPISSAFFEPLGSPANYSALIESAPADSISVVKFQAPYCRTCRASSPLLDRIAKQHPQARFYSMDLVRNGKAAGERMNRFFKERGINQMPYVEIFLGSECIETEVVPPSALGR